MAGAGAGERSNGGGIGVVAPSKQTLAELVADWLEAIKPTLRDATHYSHARNLRLHVLPHLGSVNVTAVDAGMLNAHYARLLAGGNQTKRPGASAGLSPRTVRYIHTILHRLLKDAVRWGGWFATLPTRPTRRGAPQRRAPRW